MPIRRDGEKLLQPNLVREYSEEEIGELIKCSEDIYYFTKKYVKIVHPIRGFIKMEPYPYQYDILELAKKEKFILLLLPRQSGKSTIIAVYAIWVGIFQANRSICIVSNREGSAKTILRRMKKVYEGLPEFLKPGVIEWAKTSVEFDNGTSIICGPTTEDSLSGESASILICDEFAKVRPNIAREFWSANYPIISTGGKCIVISTPKGIGNLFHQLWVDAKSRKNEFVPYQVNWWDVPGRDEEWAKKERANLGNRAFEQEHGLKFLGSSGTLIEGDILEKIAVSYKDPIGEKDNGHSKIYELCKEGHTYVVGVDSGKGLGQNNSALQIFDITFWPEKVYQVFTYANNEISVFDYPMVIYKWAYYYNMAYVMFENNAEGYAALKTLWYDLEYVNLVNVGTIDKTVVGQVKKKFDLGIRSTKTTKPTANKWFKKLVDAETVIFRDAATIEELCDYIEDNEKFYGENGLDDRITASVWAMYFFKTKFFDEKEISLNRTGKKKDDKEEKEEEPLWGIFFEGSLDDKEKSRLEFTRELMEE